MQGQEDGCPLGFKCKYSHSTFERLYHPLKYKTNPCDVSFYLLILICSKISRTRRKSVREGRCVHSITTRSRRDTHKTIQRLSHTSSWLVQWAPLNPTSSTLNLLTSKPKDLTFFLDLTFPEVRMLSVQWYTKVTSHSHQRTRTPTTFNLLILSCPKIRELITSTTLLLRTLLPPTRLYVWIPVIECLLVSQ